MLNEPAGDFDVTETVRELEEEMLTAANNLEFEKAALLRDPIRELKRAASGAQPTSGSTVTYRPKGGGGKRSRIRAG